VQPAAVVPVDNLALAPALPVSVLRIGLEHLPPERAEQEPSLERLQPLTTAPRRPRLDERRGRLLQPEDERGRHIWTMDATELAAIHSPLAREALQFVDDLMLEDRRRVRGEVREPFFQYQPIHDGQLVLWSEQAMAQQRSEWLHENGPSLLRKPLQRLWRRLPLLRDLELTLDSLRTNHLPMTQNYQQAHGSKRARGRVSVRVRPGNLDDPVEVVFMHSGLRVGSSQTVGKLSFGRQLTEKLWAELHARLNYETRRHTARINLTYWLTQTTRFHFAFGDELDFLPSASAFSFLDNPGQERTGFLLYAVHTF
jgi:hypothetical protein